jgi:SnoaL-like domain
MSNAASIVDQYQSALGRGDFAAARKFLRDDLKFSGPLDTFDRPEPYLEALQRLGPMVEKVEVLRTFSEGDEAVRLCNLHFKPPIGVCFVSEWYRLKGDKIAEVKIVFDARPFAAMAH